MKFRIYHKNEPLPFKSFELDMSKEVGCRNELEIEIEDIELKLHREIEKGDQILLQWEGDVDRVIFRGKVVGIERFRHSFDIDMTITVAEYIEPKLDLREKRLMGDFGESDNYF